MQMKSPSQKILLMTALQRHSLKLQDKMDVLQAFAKWPGIYGEVADSWKCLLIFEAMSKIAAMPIFFE